MDLFLKEKSDFLNKKDKSKKGTIDKDIIRLVNKINSKNDYYTTSSCAGRIVLLEMKSKKKNECDWIFTKHDKVKFDDINKALNDNSNNEQNNNEKINKLNPKTKTKNSEKYEIWLKQQPLILHVACRNLESAKKLLEIARKMFRRAGIIAITERKVTIEIIGSEHLETIVKDRNFTVDEKYLKQLIKYANSNFKENRNKTNRFLKLIQKL